MLKETVVFVLLAASLNAQKLVQKSKFSSFDLINDKEAIVEVVAQIASSFYFKKTSTLNIITSTSSKEDHFITDDIVKKTSLRIESILSLVQEDSEDLLETVFKKAYNIFYVDSYESFHKIFIKMNPEDFNYQGWFLIVLTRNSESQYMEMQKIFDDLWTNYIVNANVILKGSQNQKECHMFTYFPFSEFYCEKVFPVVLNTFVVGEGFVKNQTTYFPKKLSNLYKCPITVATFEIPPFVILTADKEPGNLRGFDGLLMQTIAKQMNFTLKPIILTETLWGKINDDGSSSGAISMVMKKEVNFTAGFFISTPLKNMFMTSSYVYYTSSLLWVVGPGERLGIFERFLKPFHEATWYFLIMTFVVSLIVIGVIKFQSRNVRTFVFGYQIKNPTFNMISVFLGSAMTKLPGRNFARTLLGMFLIYSLIIRNAYTGALFQFIKSDVRRHEVKDMEQMLKQDYSFFLMEAVRELVEPFESVMEKSVVLDSEQFEAFRSNLNDDDSRVAVLAASDQVTYWNEKGFPKRFYNSCPEKLSTVNFCLFMHKTSCLTSEFNRDIFEYNSSGLMSFWKSIFRDRSYLKRKNVVQVPRSLSLKHLQGGFYIFGFGLLVASAAFFGELLFRQARTPWRIVGKKF